MKVLKLGSRDFKAIINQMVRSIKQGGVAVFPTDTVYGLIADATNKKAVEKIFKIKKRPKNKPLPIFVKDLELAKKIAKIDKKQERFLGSVWPGKVTAVLERKKTKIKLYGVSEKTIALRTPSYKLVNKLLEKISRPLSETSANISGKPTSKKIKEIIRQFKNQKYQPDLILDSGNLKSSKASKVIDLTKNKIKILRK